MTKIIPVIMAITAFCFAVIAAILSWIFYRQNLSNMKEQQTHLDKASANLNEMQKNLDRLKEIEELLAREIERSDRDNDTDYRNSK